MDSRQPTRPLRERIRALAYELGVRTRAPVSHDGVGVRGGGAGRGAQIRDLLQARARSAWRLIRRHRRRIRNAAVVTCVCCVLAGAGVLLIVVSLTRGEPSWWRRGTLDGETTLQTAVTVENSMISIATRQRELDPETGRSRPWALSVDPDQANAWLNTKLRDWMTSRSDRMGWLRQIKEVQVEFDANLIKVGARIDHRGRERVFSATLAPQIREDGSLWMPARWIHIGRLTLPASWLLDDMSERSGSGSSGQIMRTSDDAGVDLKNLPEAQVMFRAFNGDQPVLIEPILKLPDGRLVRLRSLTTTEQESRLIVTCQTERNH